MGLPDPRRVQRRRHRLDALALTRQRQPGQVAAQRRAAVGVAQDLRQPLHISLEPLRRPSDKRLARRSMPRLRFRSLAEALIFLLIQ
jgi:hypothetical protein